MRTHCMLIIVVPAIYDTDPYGLGAIAAALAPTTV